MKRYFYDCEFLENGVTIRPISIGIVADDGREYYAVFEDMPVAEIKQRPWLMENVWPHLPLCCFHSRMGKTVCGCKGENRVLDPDSPLVRSRRLIANEVREFLLRPNEQVELWGYYASYDHILLSQLWGTMIQRPAGIPMWTNDVQQVAHALGLDACLPAQTGTAHNALDDARWTRDAWAYLHARSGRDA